MVFLRRTAITNMLVGAGPQFEAVFLAVCFGRHSPLAGAVFSSEDSQLEALLLAICFFPGGCGTGSGEGSQLEAYFLVVFFVLGAETGVDPVDGLEEDGFNDCDAFILGFGLTFLAFGSSRTTPCFERAASRSISRI